MFINTASVHRATGGVLAIVPRPCDLVWLWALVLLLLLCALSSSAHADVRYVYDNAGRVVQVIAADGTSAQYQYDPAGNITAINRFTAGQLVIAAFSPRTAAPGATVTISGSGFVVTPAQNTVRFNGTAATVLSATQHELVVSVPLGATTGPISVTTSAGTVSSAETFIVAEVLEITGFTPPYGAAGTVVTVTGTGFDPAPGHTSVSLAQRYVTTTSIFAQQIQFTVPTNVGSGPISVSTPNAIATTNNNF